ncbi:MAG: hypothetical protein IH940_03450 [Acidobacteria bacterium]|nr:hypothetical protein [Acidobacteriota bacterium]
MVAFVIIAVAVVAVVAVALGAVGAVSAELSNTPAPVVLDLTHEVDWIAQRLPDESAARLSLDEVKQILYWHLEYVGYQGATDDPDLIADFANVGVEMPDVEVPVAKFDDATDYVVERALTSGDEIGSLDAVVVLNLHTEYLGLLGALGPQATDDDVKDA